MKLAGFFIPVLAVLAALGLSALYVVDERENVLVLQFGQIKDIKREPGLGFKLPLIQNVVRYDIRIQGIQTQPLEVTPLDDRRLVVDAFARWRVTDVRRFREALGVGSIPAAQSRIERIMNAAIREVLGSVPSGAVLSEERTALMGRIRDQARQEARALGVDVIDVRLTRTDLPEQNLAATFARMPAVTRRHSACALWPTGPWWNSSRKRAARPRRSAVRPTRGATPSMPMPSGAIRSSSPLRALSPLTSGHSRVRTRRW